MAGWSKVLNHGSYFGLGVYGEDLYSQKQTDSEWDPKYCQGGNWSKVLNHGSYFGLGVYGEDLYSQKQTDSEWDKTDG